jgi:hypothetical protein
MFVLTPPVLFGLQAKAPRTMRAQRMIVHASSVSGHL